MEEASTPLRTLSDRGRFIAGISEGVRGAG